MNHLQMETRRIRRLCRVPRRPGRGSGAHQPGVFAAISIPADDEL